MFCFHIPSEIPKSNSCYKILYFLKNAKTELYKVHTINTVIRSTRSTNKFSLCQQRCVYNICV